MGRARRIAAGAAGMLVFILVVKLASRDDPPPQDADLIPAAIPASAADDAYPVYRRLDAALALTQEERGVLSKDFDGAVPDEPAVAGFIARSTEALALFARLDGRSAFLDPNYRDLSTVGPATPVPIMASVVAAAEMTSLQAESLLKAGRARDALAKSLLIVDAGRALTRARAQLLPNLVGTLLVQIGAKRALAAARSGRLDRATLLEAAARLSEPTDAAASLQNGLRYEYVRQAYTLDHLDEFSIHRGEAGNTPRNLMIASMARGGWYAYLPHRTKALFAGRFHLLVAEAARPCLQARIPPFSPLPIGLRPNIVGRILFNIATPSYEKLYTRRCETDFRLTAAAAGAALQAYRLDHGRFPASLSELTPGYLAAAPVDAFTDAAPVYSSQTGEIHSAGADSEGKPL
ncbi:MAG TPA: hypothetical protein VH309_09025 [Elusimicrobiota bacterium]|nr:hypothetical protein [Elusimicrobiota bacterium]